MKASTVLLLLTLYMGAGRGAQEGGCGRAGALRCDADGRHLSACTKGGAWWPVRDCGASLTECVNGRCVPQRSSGATRADECTPGTWGCRDCKTRQYCLANGNWFDVDSCGINYVCISGECKPKVTNPCNEHFICSESAVDKKFPNPSNCRQYLFCLNAWDTPVAVPCFSGANFDPCVGECVEGATCWDNEPCSITNNAQLKVVLGNPSLYYLCADGMAIFYKCEDDLTFYPFIEKCLLPVIPCPN